ncbi:hypothetical protein [Comamonas thiooxydans]|uniref:hypothetical protein n=1 Tax=Comamonas thiooxydans TaxID=363952 RepID=UPI00209BD946|nr:hypothetical protein [Comamonas thiooxydans]MCO8248337.1 hypothetical protein [Comamonas thiooxydans]
MDSGITPGSISAWRLTKNYKTAQETSGVETTCGDGLNSLPRSLINKPALFAIQLRNIKYQVPSTKCRLSAWATALSQKQRLCATAQKFGRSVFHTLRPRTQHAARSTHVQLAALLPAHMGLRAELVPLHGQKEPKSRLSFIGLRYWIAPAICGLILPALFFRERF